MEGQRWHSTVVDLAFFVTVCLLGFRQVLHETVLATLLGMYAAGRFGVAHGKQQAVIALSGSGSGSVPPTGSGGSGGSGASGEHRLHLPPQESSLTSTSKKVDPRTLQQTRTAVDLRLASLGWWG